MFVKSIIILALLATPALSLPKPKPQTASDEKHLEPKTDELKNKQPTSDAPVIKKQEELDSKLDAKVDDSGKVRVEAPKAEQSNKDVQVLEKSPEKAPIKSEDPKLEQQKGQQQDLKDEEPSKIPELIKPEQQKQEPLQHEEQIKQQTQESVAEGPKKESKGEQQQSIKAEQPQPQPQPQQQQQEDLKEEDKQEQQFEEQQQLQEPIPVDEPKPPKKGLSGKQPEKLEQSKSLASAPRGIQQDLINASNTFYSRKQALKARLFGTYQTPAPIIWVESERQPLWQQQQLQQKPHLTQQQQLDQQQSQTPLFYSASYYPNQRHTQYGYQTYNDYRQRPSVFSRLFGYRRPVYIHSSQNPVPRYYY